MMYTRFELCGYMPETDFHLCVNGPSIYSSISVYFAKQMLQTLSSETNGELWLFSLPVLVGLSCYVNQMYI